VGKKDAQHKGGQRGQLDFSYARVGALFSTWMERTYQNLCKDVSKHRGREAPTAEDRADVLRVMKSHIHAFADFSSMRVEGRMVLANLNVEGCLRLSRCRIEGDLECDLLTDDETLPFRKPQTFVNNDLSRPDNLDTLVARTVCSRFEGEMIQCQGDIQMAGLCVVARNGANRAPSLILRNTVARGRMRFVRRLDSADCTGARIELQDQCL
jgi:hypothetical protein